MYSYAFLLITICQLVVSSPEGRSVGVIMATNNGTTKSTTTYAFDSGYKVYPGIGILKFHNALLDWNEARETCIREGAELAVINSAFEESKIAEYQAINNVDSFWIGIHDYFKSRNWLTVSGQSIGYVHWNKGEPNVISEHCVAYEKTGYSDFDCSRKSMFICKIYLK